MVDFSKLGPLREEDHVYRCDKCKREAVCIFKLPTWMRTHEPGSVGRCKGRLSFVETRARGETVSQQKPSQRARARECIAALDANPRDVAALAALRTVIGEAQNGPPDGAADGSIDGPLWMALQHMADSAEAWQHRRAQLSAVGR